MIIRVFGSALILAGSWLTGRAVVKAGYAELKRTEKLLSLTEELQYQVIRLETPLPRLLAMLEEQRELLSPDYAPLPVADFSERWLAYCAALRTGEAVREAMKELGTSLSHSHEGEKCFELALRRMRDAAEALQESYGEKKRLAPALGGCAGVVLVLLLLE